MPAAYVKHLLECHCVLPQFKHVDPPRWHHFVVFSEIEGSGNLIPSFAQCNNCGVVHKVMEVGVSSILKRDNLPSLPSLEEIKSGLPEKLVGIMERYQCDLPSYQEAQFVFEHKLWGHALLLSKETLDGIMATKYVQILGESLWKITSFQEEYDHDQPI